MVQHIVPSPPPTAATGIQVPWERVEQFVGNLTHDVRNGLNTIELQLTFLAEIATQPEVTEEIKKLRASVAEAARELHAVRASIGKVIVHPFPYPAADFVEDLRDRLQKRLGPDFERVSFAPAPAGEMKIELDPEQTMDAVVAVLQNALLFATPGTPFVLRTSQMATGWKLFIEEKPATAPESDPAEWGRTPMTSARRGAYGLGLFHARQAIEAQRGNWHCCYHAPENLLVTTMMLPPAE